MDHRQVYIYTPAEDEDLTTLAIAAQKDHPTADVFIDAEGRLFGATGEAQVVVALPPEPVERHEGPEALMVSARGQFVAIDAHDFGLPHREDTDAGVVVVYGQGIIRDGCVQVFAEGGKRLVIPLDRVESLVFGAEPPAETTETTEGGV